ncbi:uncharacterized protein [Coffea arabica]|uniref:RNase H type-1 domain-containing protein n=1 Tax=Coffea arabica TaxID=13443 RepID=A0ABM4URA6_COFAR
MGIIFESGDKIEMQSFVMTLWMIWHARNKLLFEGICMKTEVTVDWVRAYLREFNQRKKKNENGAGQELVKKWQPPARNLLKINVDAAWSEEKAGIGIIVRNENGEIMAAMAEGIGKMLSIELAELVAVSIGLQWAKEVGIGAFILESDLVNVVQRLNSREVDLSVGHVVDEVRKHGDEFQ